MHRRELPILEFDPAREATINPRQAVAPADVPAACVLCFFREVLQEVAQLPGVRTVATLKSEIGPEPVVVVPFEGQEIVAFHPGVGAPLSAAFLEELIALGCRKFVACGSAGVLDRQIAVGHVLLPTSAVRDEGTSYHYLPAAREVSVQRSAVEALEATLRAEEIDYLACKTWTTDAIYRETPDKVALRRSEGCLTVEMEAAALLAVAEFRGVPLGYLLYGGDDVSGTAWDHRHYLSQNEARRRLFWLAAVACVRL